jgi:hypothetical protein
LFFLEKNSLVGLFFFLSYENPTLGVGGSEALKAIGQDKKTPFGV